jgi:hypothetical protein
MQREPMWWPASRPDLAALGREGPDAILRVMKRRPKRRWTKAELQRATGKSEATINNLVLSMKEAGEIVCVAPGVFALPQAGARKHVSASWAIIHFLLSVPAYQATTEQLVVALGRKRNAVDSAAHRMLKAYAGNEKALLVQPQRGTFALSPHALRKIQRGDSLRTGKRLLVPDQLSMWPILDGEPPARSR